MKLVTQLFILLTLACVAICSQCPPGKYKTNNAVIPCYFCPAGSYCPGDDQSHKCPKGTISPSTATQCSPCTSGRTNEESTYCLLPSTPSDAIEIHQDRPFKVNSKSTTFAFININSPSYINTTFITFVGKDLNGIVVYASNQTATPSSSNSMYQATGVNATIISTVANGILYFSLETKNSANLEFIPRVLSSEVHKINMDGNVYDVEHASFNQNLVLFQYNDFTKKGSTLNIYLELDSGFELNALFIFSNNPNTVVLTPDNADVVVPVKENIKTKWQFTQPRDGPVVVALYSFIPLYDVKIYLSIMNGNIMRLK